MALVPLWTGAGLWANPLLRLAPTGHRDWPSPGSHLLNGSHLPNTEPQAQSHKEPLHGTPRNRRRFTRRTQWVRLFFFASDRAPTIGPHGGGRRLKS